MYRLIAWICLVNVIIDINGYLVEIVILVLDNTRNVYS